MDTVLLEVFRTVARLGSLTAAAQRLQFTQSAVSRQIATLEADLGTQLFDRLPRGVALTEEGRALLPHAEAILDRVTTARRAVDDLRTLSTGRLRVGAFPTAVAALVPRALATFRQTYTEITVSLIEGLTPTLLTHLTTGEADIAVVSESPAGPIDETRFTLHHILDERLLVAVPRTHPLARRRTVRLQELEADSFIAGSANAEETLLRASLPAGFTPRIDIVAADWTAKLGCVAAGLGVALIPALAMRTKPADVALLRLHRDDEPTRRIQAATLAGRTPSAAVGRFLPLLQAAVDARWTR
ncbi:LysR substrate-binding domain-containing protein [Actinoplanes sp. Pm04-4]|uniref:LysR substrate-binding domain-containing protein n=1 Tax=Paractinoplanes pyxinae TaxID=2997416 RepID=A0ABT4AVV1_9ACTN|nr:LysR substrate-binding domain-containing protein [Actinoplanes pyxinae]MCY1138352.1 LysR substrate-binding domain-containing protein [Actinoplanes pyxinae]